MTQRKTRGFSLIELLVVVAVIGIMAAIAYPAYTTSILKGKRAQARTALAELMQQQERYMTQRNCYLAFTNTSANATAVSALVPATACGGVAATSIPFKTFSGDNLASAAYTLSADNCDASPSGSLSIQECVRVNATPIKPDPETAVLRLTSTGVKDCTGTKAASDPALCWP